MKKYGLLLVALVIVYALSGCSSPVQQAEEVLQDVAVPFTSVTGNADPYVKASVFVSEKTVDEVVRAILDKKPTRNYEYADDRSSCILYYDDVVYLVYEGEDEKVYIQVSNRKYVSQNGFHHVYRPRTLETLIFYDMWYRSRYAREDYERYGGGYSRGLVGTNTSSKSVKTGSTTTRTTTGGGTSFGK